MNQLHKNQLAKNYIQINCLNYQPNCIFKKVTLFCQNVTFGVHGGINWYLSRKQFGITFIKYYCLFSLTSNSIPKNWRKEIIRNKVYIYIYRCVFQPDLLEQKDKKKNTKLNTMQPCKSQLWIKCYDLKFSAHIHKPYQNIYSNYLWLASL